MKEGREHAARRRGKSNTASLVGDPTPAQRQIEDKNSCIGPVER
ncbi:hypothetical protein NG2371_06235 [Nocardia gamkensis]|nr:hypothetical protein [Nocardia gamkensis]